MNRNPANEAAAEAVTEDGTKREAFSRLTQVNLAVTLFGVLVLATPVLFVIAAIGPGASMVRLGLAIVIVWLVLIVCSVIFASRAARHGYLGK